MTRASAAVFVALTLFACGGSNAAERSSASGHEDPRPSVLDARITWLDLDPAYPYAVTAGIAVLAVDGGIAGITVPHGSIEWLNEGFDSVLAQPPDQRHVQAVLSNGNDPLVVALHYAPHEGARWDSGCGYSVLDVRTGEVVWERTLSCRYDMHLPFGLRLGDGRLYHTTRLPDEPPITRGYALDDGTLLFEEVGWLRNLALDGSLIIRQPAAAGRLDAARLAVIDRDGVLRWARESDITSASSDGELLFGVLQRRHRRWTRVLDVSTGDVLADRSTTFQFWGTSSFRRHGVVIGTRHRRLRPRGMARLETGSRG